MRSGNASSRYADLPLSKAAGRPGDRLSEQEPAGALHAARGRPCRRESGRGLFSGVVSLVDRDRNGHRLARIYCLTARSTSNGSSAETAASLGSRARSQEGSTMFSGATVRRVPLAPAGVRCGSRSVVPRHRRRAPAGHRDRRERVARAVVLARRGGVGRQIALGRREPERHTPLRPALGVDAVRQYTHALERQAHRTAPLPSRPAWVRGTSCSRSTSAGPGPSTRSP